MEWRKIALACFVGGCVCTTVAIKFAPIFWWLGLLSGFVAGYLSYEFKTVFWAIYDTIRVNIVGLIPIIAREKKRVKEFIFGDINPLLSWSPILMFISTFWFYCYLEMDRHTLPIAIIDYIVLIIMSLFMFVVIVCVTTTLLLFGSEVKKCYWGANDTIFSEQDTWRNKENGFREIKLTYGKFFIFMFIGLIALCKKIFILIHSHQRVLCGIDGTLGGILAYWLVNSMILPMESKIVAIIFGGILGAGFGIVNYQVVSKKILKLETA